ncbi:Shedu anti-phage system protein SduA domain-containing protein [Neobacillus niacini]|uniref:Shedu anti-phage system protein SduA domain-containing protein n=1 Tax=Neobacillus niacini TaxID=86668 RepID=UPI002FFD992B
MKIYSRDYKVLNEQELIQWEDLQEREIVRRIGKIAIRRNLYREYPSAVRHFISLFPNNHLDIEDLQQREKLEKLVHEYSDLISEKETTERTILNWIKEKQAYFIIASIMKSYYSFGHHDAYIFPEFQLGNSYQVDYLIIGQNSGGYEFILVELEHPNKKVTLADGYEGESLRKGLKQVRDWKSWLEGNYSSLYETFNKYKGDIKTLPIEFMRYDSSRIHYAVVAGKRSDFKEKTYEIKRQKLAEKVLLLHYDNLYDTANSVIGEATY